MSSMLDPDHRQSPAREFVHKGKGCLAVIVALGVLVFGGYFVFDQGRTFLSSSFGDIPDYEGTGAAPITVTVPEGATVDQIGGILVEQDVIKSIKAWNRAVSSEERATSIQPGRYLMQTQMPAIDALRLLINPGSSRVRSQFTVQEGLRLSAQIDALVKGTKIKKSAYTAALKKPSTLGLPKYAKNNPEGFLFPDTYELTEDATARSTMVQMTTQFKRVAADLQLEEAAKRLGRKPLDLVIVASIIEREVAQDEYRAKVAQVLYNRLDAGMHLGLDSTVVYAEKLKTNTTTPADRQSNSPYNTYKFKGLPPGPISAPGKAALEAAANPEPGDWLFFVTVNFDTGETKFAEDEAGFNRIREEFRAWCRANTGRCDS